MLIGNSLTNVFPGLRGSLEYIPRPPNWHPLSVPSNSQKGRNYQYPASTIPELTWSGESDAGTHEVAPNQENIKLKSSGVKWSTEDHMKGSYHLPQDPHEGLNRRTYQKASETQPGIEETGSFLKVHSAHLNLFRNHTMGILLPKQLS